jgi:hypothetical protein
VVFAASTASDASDDNNDDNCGFGKLTQDLPYMVILVEKKSAQTRVMTRISETAVSDTIHH